MLDIRIESLESSKCFQAGQIDFFKKQNQNNKKTKKKS